MKRGDVRQEGHCRPPGRPGQRAVFVLARGPPHAGEGGRRYPGSSLEPGLATQPRGARKVPLIRQARVANPYRELRLLYSAGGPTRDSAGCAARDRVERAGGTVNEAPGTRRRSGSVCSAGSRRPLLVVSRLKAAGHRPRVVSARPADPVKAGAAERQGGGGPAVRRGSPATPAIGRPFGERACGTVEGGRGEGPRLRR